MAEHDEARERRYKLSDEAPTHKIAPLSDINLSRFM